MASLLRQWQRGKKFLRLVTRRRTAMPHEIQIEVTNRCNLDCDMCPRLSVLAVPERDMSQELYERILGQLEEPQNLTLTGWGEPLMHPQLFDFLALARERFPTCELGFTTNGHLLDEARVEKILAASLSRVTISLEELPWTQGSVPAESAREHGLNPKKGHGNSHAQSGHPSSDRVVSGLKRLVEARKGGPRPELRLQSVMSAEARVNVPDLIDFAADLGVDVLNLVRLDGRGIAELNRPSWEDERQILSEARKRAQSRGLRIESANDHGALLRLASHSDRACLRVDDYVYIDVDGRVAPCCLLRNEALGDLKTQNLRDLWQSEGMARFSRSPLPSACEGCDAFMNGYRQQAGRSRIEEGLKV